MGLLDFVKGGVRELMIARPDSEKHLLVYKHPDSNIPNHALLTIDLDECAVFFRSGTPPVVAVLPPGRHPLSTENLPFLSRFVTSFTGGNVLQAEVFFVKTQPIRGLTFGGQLMSMRDPELDLRVTPRAYGTYAIQIVDPVRFIVGYTGQAAQGDNDAITSWLRQRMFQGLGKTLGGFLKSGQTTFMDLGVVAPDLAAALARDCPDFAEVGVRILEIGELKISLSEADQARVDALQNQIAEAKLRARVAKVGVSQAQAEAEQRQFELDQRFQQDARYVQQLAGNWQNYAMGQAVMGAAGHGSGDKQGGGGGIAGVGAEMALGMGMAGWVQQQMQQPAQPPRAPQPGTPPGGASGPAPSAGKVTCPSCSAQVLPGKFCQECGAALAPARRFCSGCGVEVSGKFCSSCGAPMSG